MRGHVERLTATCSTRHLNTASIHGLVQGGAGRGSPDWNDGNGAIRGNGGGDIVASHIAVLGARPPGGLGWPGEGLSLAPGLTAVGGGRHTNVDLAGRGGTTASIPPIIVGDSEMSVAIGCVAINGQARRDMFDIAADSVQGMRCKWVQVRPSVEVVSTISSTELPVSSARHFASK